MNNQNSQAGRDHGRGHSSQRGRCETPIQASPARVGLPVGPQDDIKQIADCLIKARLDNIVLAPAMQLDHLPPCHKVTFAVLMFPVDGIETWQDRSGDENAKDGQSNGVWFSVRGGGLAHTRTSLDMLCQAAGISTVHSECGRVDDRRSPFYWEYRMTVERTLVDGTVVRTSRGHSLDLRNDGDGIMSPAATTAAGKEGLDGKALRAARINGAQVCESKAHNRAVRAALGLSAYCVEDARKPFVIPVLRFVPDMSDPEVRRMVTAKALGIVSDIYGSATPPAPALRVIDAEPAPQAPAPRQLAQPNDLPTEMDRLAEQRRRDAERQHAPRNASAPRGGNHGPADDDGRWPPSGGGYRIR